MEIYLNKFNFLMKRQSVLLVTSRFPFPLIGGDRLRIFNLLCQLNRIFDVTLLTLGNPSANDLDGLRKASGILAIHCIPHSRYEAYWGSIKALFNGKPLQVGYFESVELNRQVKQFSSNTDLCIFHLIRTSSAWQGAADIPVVLEMCDAISANYEQTSKEGAWYAPWRIISRVEGPRAAKFEIQEAKRFDLISLHTRRDADKVGVEPDKLMVSTQGANLSGLAFKSPLDRSGTCIALIGRMDFFPNWHGAQWFAESVLPLLPKDMKLKVVGDCSAKVRRRLESIDRVIVTGKVEKLDDACSDCFAAIAPMHVATGIQNKVLEYFAMGLPSVVSPSVAAGLLPAAVGGYLAADTVAQWVSAIDSIAAGNTKADAMAQHALRYVKSNHSWDEIGDLYNQRLLNLLDKEVNLEI
jgi:glycosyltransferase involved in cell wall biosynthesis